jgi:hypothetical protein
VRHVAAAYAGMALKLPALPTQYAAFNIGAMDSYTVQPTLVKVTGGYDQARKRIFAGAPGDVAPAGGEATAAYGLPTSKR